MPKFGRSESFEGAARPLSSRFIEGQTEDGAPHPNMQAVAVRSQLDRINRLEMGKSNDNMSKGYAERGKSKFYMR